MVAHNNIIKINKYKIKMKKKYENKHSPPLLDSPSCSVPSSPTIPVKTYFNAEADKATILSDNKNKAGIYM